jgi:hypothetical protein
MRYQAFSISLGIGLCLAPQVFAHHSGAMFDSEVIVTFDGVVTRYEWRNPHVFFRVETTEASGETVEWQIEADGIPLLTPLGWTAESLEPGDRVTVRGSPARNPARRAALGRDIVKEDGTVLIANPEFALDRAVGSTGVASNLAGKWLPRWEEMMQVTRGRLFWPLTEKGKAAVAQYHDDPFDTSANPQIECIPTAAPLIMMYATVDTIEFGDDTVNFHIDWMNVERTVYMDGRGHPENGERSLQGHSIGRWEDETLVVDTVDLADNAMGNTFGLPSGAQKHVVERFSLSEDGTQLIYGFVLEDPEYLAASVTRTYAWDYRPDLERGDSECDLETAGRF